ASGQGTIKNDDVASLSINDVQLPEGTGATTLFGFTISLSNPIAAPVSVRFDTADGTATAADRDYTPIVGELITFNPDDRPFRVVSVDVAGDDKSEQDETFSVLLSGATGPGVTISRAQGTGEIVNDDTPALFVGDVRQPEGDAGSSAFAFAV